MVSKTDYSSFVSPFKTFSSLIATVDNCFLCPIATILKVFGEGNEQADLVLIGTGPGRVEAMKGRVFVGPSGDVLRQVMEHRDVNLTMEDVYIANVIRCRPIVPGKPRENRDPTEEEIGNCDKYLFSLLKLIRPKIIVTLGAIAARTLLRNIPKIDTMRISMLRKRIRQGEILMSPFGRVIVAYHPSFILRSRSPELELELKLDLAKAKKLAGL